MYKTIKIFLFNKYYFRYIGNNICCNGSGVCTYMPYKFLPAIFAIWIENIQKTEKKAA